MVLLYLTMLIANISFSKTQVSEARMPELAENKSGTKRDAPIYYFFGSCSLPMCYSYLRIHIVSALTMVISERTHCVLQHLIPLYLLDIYLSTYS